MQGPHSGPLAFSLTSENLLCELEIDTRHLLLGDKIYAWDNSKGLENIGTGWKLRPQSYKQLTDGNY